MAKKALPCPTVLRQLLRYEPETGKLFWRERGPEWFAPKGTMSAEGISSNWNSRHAGREAFTSPTRVYRSGSVLGASVMAHRVAWAMVHGVWPKLQIDHINGNKWDNRLCNLREVTARENCRNKPSQKNTGPYGVGVRWVKGREKWQASIKANGRTHFLGHFKDGEDAVAARKMAEQKYGFHENHGR